MANQRNPNKKMLGIYLEPANFESLRRLAAIKGKSMSELVKIAISQMATKEGITNAKTRTRVPEQSY